MISIDFFIFILIKEKKISWNITICCIYKKVNKILSLLLIYKYFSVCNIILIYCYDHFDHETSDTAITPDP